MKSGKYVKSLSEIVLPFVFYPINYIKGSINGKGYEFFPGQPNVMTPAEYEAIYHSLYAKELDY